MAAQREGYRAMRQLFSGIVLAVALCGIYASAQNVTQTLPRSTVKLNGASGGGGDITGVEVTGTAPIDVTGSPCTTGDCSFEVSCPTCGTGTGTGFTYDVGDEIWIFEPASGVDATMIRTDSMAFNDAADSTLLQILPAAAASGSGVTTYFAGRLAAAAIEQREVNTLSATGTIVGANVLCSTGAGAVVGTLNASTANVGQFVYVTRSGANTCTIGVESGHTLDGVTDGTTTVASAGWKTFVQTGDTAWVTQASYPTTGTISGLTTGNVPYATSATTLADSPEIRESADIMSQRNGKNAQERQLYATYSGAGANYERLVTRTLSTSVWRWMTEKAGTGATRSYRWGIDGTDYLFLTSSSLSVAGQAMPSVTDTYNVGGTSNLWMTGFFNRGFQGGKSKALVDATATNVWQIAVANNSYEGLTLDYTVFATDGTDRQVRAGSIPVSILNNGGTETCVFGTATDAVNTSTGTLTVTWDCTAGTDTVMIRANADTSLASTTTFTIESRPNLTSGTATVTPQ